LFEAKGEVKYAATFVEWFAEEAKRVCGDVITSPSPSQRLFVLKQPVGVAALWTPVSIQAEVFLYNRVCSWQPRWRSKTIKTICIKIKVFSQWKKILNCFPSPAWLPRTHSICSMEPVGYFVKS